MTHLKYLLVGFLHLLAGMALFVVGLWGLFYLYHLLPEYVAGFERIISIVGVSTFVLLVAYSAGKSYYDTKGS